MVFMMVIAYDPSVDAEHKNGIHRYYRRIHAYTAALSLFNHITLTPHEKQHYRPPDSVSDDFVAFGDVS